MTITLDTSTTPADTIVEGPGWKQTTPPDNSRKTRTYEETAQTCELGDATDMVFESLTAVLGRCFPGDFAGPTLHWTAQGVVDNIRTLATLDPDQLADTIKTYSATELKRRSNRGSAVHRAIEARLKGQPVDYDDLERNGAMPWLAAVDRWIDEARPSATLIESVAFHRGHRVACTIDFFGDMPGIDLYRVMADHKSREKPGSHDRHAKDAAQVGGQISLATEGYYMDERGRRRQLEQVDHAGILTFCPDSTWAYHPIAPQKALDSWNAAVNVRPYTLISNVYDKAHKGAPLTDLDVQTIVARRLAALTPEAKKHLANRWKVNGLPQIPQLTVDHWALADKLLADVEPKPAPPRTEYASIEACAAIHDRIEALPEDLRASVRRAGGGLVNPLAAVVDCQQLADWERLIEPAEAVASRRPGQATIILEPLTAQQRQAVVFCVIRHNLESADAVWTDHDLDRLAELVDGIVRGDLYVTDDGNLAITPAVMDALPKRETTAAAKRVAEAIGRPRPTKFSDLVADPVLFSAMRAA